MRRIRIKAKKNLIYLKEKKLLNDIGTNSYSKGMALLKAIPLNSWGLVIKYKGPRPEFERYSYYERDNFMIQAFLHIM